MPVMEPWRYDRKMTAMMVEDFLHDPVLAAYVLLGIRVPPNQELRMLAMWYHHYTQDDSGFSTGKSTTLAIVSALRSVLLEGRIGAIVSGTFRQGQLIFRNFDRWYSKCPMFRFCVRFAQGKPKISHATSAWEIQFKGGSLIRTLPPDFVRDSVRLQSERWNDGYFDEWPTFNMHSLVKVLFGRVTALNENQDCIIRQNHIHLCGTPGFKHHPAYRLVRQVDNNIARGNKDYCRFTSNWRHVPRTREWKGFIDYKIIYTMQTMNPEGVVRSEIDGLWQDDSMSYYSIVSIDEARSPILFAKHKRTRAEEFYFMGFDTARGNAKTSKGHGGRNSGGDDFSATILRATTIHEPAQHCLTIRKHNVTAEHIAGIVHELHQSFQCTYIVYDPMGGGLFVRDELRKSECFIRNQLQRVTPLIEMDDTTGTLGDPFLIPFRRNAFHFEMMWGKMQSDSVMNNRAHRGLSNAIESKKILLAQEWKGWDHLGSHWDVDAKRAWLNKNSKLSEAERQVAEMDLAVCQLAIVDVERDESGTPKVDTYNMWKFKSKAKKDAAYGLLYAHTGFMIWKNFQETGRMSNDAGGDMGFTCTAM